LCDSGASAHLSPNSGDFTHMNNCDRKIITADGRIHQANASGDVRLNVRLLDGSSHTVILSGVLYVPSFRYSLVSESCLDGRGVRIVVEKGKRVYEKEGKSFMVAEKQDGLWHVKLVKQKALLSTYEETHQALGHPSVIKDCYKDYSATTPPKDFRCETCEIQKSKHTSPPPIQISTTEPFEKVHSDLSGRMPVKTFGNNEYYMTFVDDYTRYCWIYLLKTKNGAEIALRHFWELIETQFKTRIKRLHPDNGTEYINQNVIGYLKSKGTVHTTSPPYHHELNGVAERINRTLHTMVLCMMPNDRKFLWGEAYSAATYLYNRRWHSKVNTTPFKRLYRMKPSIDHIRPWYTHALVHVPSETRGRFDQPAVEGYLVGYTSNPTVFRIYILKRGTITEAKDVKFDRIRGISSEYHHTLSIEDDVITPQQQQLEPKESSIPGTFPKSPQTSKKDSTSNPQLEQQPRKSQRSKKRTEKGKELDKSGTRRQTRSRSRKREMLQQTKTLIQETENDLEGSDLDDDETQVLQEQHTRLMEKMRELDTYLKDDEVAGLMYHVPDPNSYKEAKESGAREEWKTAMDEEIKVLMKREVGKEVERPMNRDVLKGRWVYKTKVKKDGTIERRKGRYCAKGFSQRPGEDYEEVYAPVARLELLRLLLSISINRGYTIRQLDVKSAFLYGDIDIETYLELPEGYRKPGKVWKLNKAIYGLKQSPCLWFQHLTKALESMNLSTSDDFDPCILVSKDLYCCVYVDDILIAGKPRCVKECINKLQSQFQCTDSGEASLLLGMQIVRTEDKIRLYQERYINEILTRFNMTEVKPVATPIEIHSVMVSAKDGDQRCEQKHYQSIIGSLMYASIATRPDIAHATTYLSQFSSDPTMTHLTAAKRVLRYLKGTIHHGLSYYRNNNSLTLEVYSDASFASNLDDRISYTGLIVQNHKNTVIWRSKKQKSVTLSTTEAEYVALCCAVQQSIWIKRGLSLMDINTTPTVYCDNTATIKLAGNEGVSDRTKHIDVKYHYTRQMWKRKEIRLEHVDTKENVADICTKGLSKVLHDGFLVKIGMET